MNRNNNPYDNELLQRYPEQQAELRIMLEQIAERPIQDQDTELVLVRYDREAIANSYQTEPEALIELIRGKSLFQGSEAVVDLGAGPGQLIEKLAAIFPDVQMNGIDLSPGFVRNFTRRNKFSNAKMNVGLIDCPLTDPDQQNKTSVLSVLTFDRLAYPKMLIENMARFNKAKILATLLPVVPEDDNLSRQGAEKIVYTSIKNRIVPGKDADEDREVLGNLLEKTWKQPVDFAEVDYTVSSSGDRQEYKLGVFFTQGDKDATKVQFLVP